MKKKTQAVQEPKFTKAQLKKSVEFAVYRDLLEAILDREQTYTKNEVRKIINNFLNAEVE